MIGFKGCLSAVAPLHLCAFTSLPPPFLSYAVPTVTSVVHGTEPGLREMGPYLLEEGTAVFIVL